jgi:hypothetical protein
MKETIDQKARRLVDADAVRVLEETAEVVVAGVVGDSGTVWRVTRSSDGTFAGCSCPAVTRCSHLIATEIVTATNYGGNMYPNTYDPDDPERPFETADPETGEILRYHVDSQSHDTSGGEPPLSAPTPSSAIPRDADTALMAIADAPVTMQTLKAISKTEFVPTSLRGRPEAILACVLFGRSMNLDPMQALTHVHIIEGRPSPSAELLLRMIRAGGHQVEVKEATDQAVTLTGTRSDDGSSLEVTFTLADAERGGLISIDEDGRPRARSQNDYPLPWEQYTPDLLWARAVTRLHRRLFPDVISLQS